MTWANLNSNPDWVAPDPLYSLDGNNTVIADGVNRTASEILRNSEFERTLVIDRILRLLIKLIGSLQEVTANLSQRLKFLTQWQKAYTDQMDQVAAFSVGAPSRNSAIGGEGDGASSARDELNRVNATYTDQLKGRQSIVGNDADQLQTTVNQLSDSVSQATNIATSLLQQLSTLLTSIFKK